MSVVTNRGKYLLLQKKFRSNDTMFAALLTGVPVAISDASNASPIVITTATNHNLVTGDLVLIFGIGGNTAANGVFRVTVSDGTHFSLNGSTGNGAYTSGGTMVKQPNEDANTMADVSEIAAGNGYTAGGIQLTCNSTDFDVLTEDDVNNLANVQVKDLVWTAAGGPIPISGNAAYFLALTDDNVTPSARQIFAITNLGGGRTVSDTQQLTIQNVTISAENYG